MLNLPLNVVPFVGMSPQTRRDLLLHQAERNGNVDAFTGQTAINMETDGHTWMLSLPYQTLLYSHEGFLSGFLNFGSIVDEAFQ